MKMSEYVCPSGTSSPLVLFFLVWELRNAEYSLPAWQDTNHSVPLAGVTVCFCNADF